MRRVIAAINMTLDGVFDHTAGIPDEEVHRHYTMLLSQGDMILYGRTTFRLMEYWRSFLDKPSEQQSMNEFARAIDRIPKIVFSRTLKNVDWPTAELSQEELVPAVAKLKQQPGGDIFVGSRSLIIQLMRQKLVDQLQLCIYPVVAGSGRLLFEDMQERYPLRLVNTRIFTGGAVIHYYDLY